MSHRDLKNKPLVEAVLEVRWRLAGQPPGPQSDPHYKLLLGRLYDRLQAEYPEHESLPTANIPDELVGHVVQHRFRVGPTEWPLVQLGPGIFAVNETGKYVWSEFRNRVVGAVGKLYEAHPKASELVIESLSLRYIDAVEFDYNSRNVLEFLRDNLKVAVDLPVSLFDNTGVEDLPQSCSLQTTFRCQEPPGQVHVSFATGRRDERPALLWDTTVRSSEQDVPSLPDGFPAWVDSAHAITSDWFFKLIEGNLERRFSND